jgi:hypothetical protein
MKQMFHNIDSTVSDENARAINSQRLADASYALERAGLDTLISGIDIPTKKNAVVLDPAVALENFNAKLNEHMNKVYQFVIAAESRKTDENYKALSDIVRGDWKVLKELMSEVRENDLNEMGQVMREYVMWNSFIGNAPVLGSLGKTIGSLQMIMHGWNILKRDKAHVRSNMLDNYVIAKNADKLINRITEGLERVEAETDKAIRLYGLRQVGRVGTSGLDRREAVDKNDYSPESRALIEAFESSIALEPVPTAEPVVNRIDTAVDRVINSPVEQQSEEFTRMMESGEFTEDELDQIAEKLEQYVSTPP